MEMTKEELLDKIATGILLAILLIVLLFGCYLDATYPMRGSVYEIKGNTIYLEDERGEIFAYTDSKDAREICIGQKCRIILDHQCTESNPKDDRIVSVKYR